jgi:L-seryl-tRNA(Ser) seleniumtransferase
MKIPEYIQKIPKVDKLYQQISIKPQYMDIPRSIIIQTIQNTLERLRQGIKNGIYNENDLDTFRVIQQVQTMLDKAIMPNLQPVINATGIIVHTNLGRSLLGSTALDQIIKVACHYSNLEYDLETGKRGHRYQHVENLICSLTDAESAAVVNNNAGAVLLTLRTIASDKAVIVSRGELIEIGGSFRIPDIMALSGAKLVEVGTTNRTHLHDYQHAISSDTGLLLKVHPSNYAIKGFTASVDLKEMVKLGKAASIPVMYDMGSGNLVDLSSKGLADEPVVQRIVSTGVDIVTFSGDKLLGGPQAGIIVGNKSIIDQIKKNPMARALRIDKLTLAALEGTLRLYQDPKTVFDNVPTLAFISRPLSEIKHAVETVYSEVQSLGSDRFLVKIIQTNSKIGGGALPLQKLPSYCIGITSEESSVDSIEKYFRTLNPPVIGRIENDQFLLDFRTVLPAETKILQRFITHLHQSDKSDWSDQINT